ncbi:Neurotrimin [Temnothorax longispinosus]|uniref:Neurotrimin n=1 Tax=Temnothorax longispinosus TaxID=300112 RepID=A0A4S2KK05_9HYME|nr:Neurotrimin [Temnothorax longispinosus]
MRTGKTMVEAMMVGDREGGMWRTESGRLATDIHKNVKTITVAWLRVDTQTILTIAGHVITKNHRISVTHIGHRLWSLHIKDTRKTDSGWYMCQVNTDPMSSITGFLEVVDALFYIDAVFYKDVSIAIRRIDGDSKLCLVYRLSTKQSAMPPHATVIY